MREGFFAVDRRAWDRACALGVNPGVAYLVMNRAAGADRRSTLWAVEAVQTRTGITAPRAMRAVEILLAAGLVELGDRGAFLLRPAHLIPGLESEDRAPAWMNLPVGFVDGVGSALPDLEIARQLGDIEALRSAVDSARVRVLLSYSGQRTGHLRRPVLITSPDAAA